MQGNIIDFSKSKEKLLSKKFPNISKETEGIKKSVFLRSNMAFDSFQTIFFNYQEYLSDPENNKEVKLEEVFVYFNRYFDELYKELIRFDDEKVPKFKEALDYAMLGSGKRLRPFLMFVAYNFLKGEECIVLSPFMVAIELIHTFSLIHDDLPCMDNDELRRGKPTVWKKYGEDIAVLVGDALMMHAGTLLLETILELGYTNYASLAITSGLVLMRLAGLDGMITGQVFDVMNTTNRNLTLEDLSYMYDKKTTALLTAAITIGANMSGRIDDKLENIENLSMCIGEAYQIKDDLLEVESTTEKIGKSVDSDKNNNKVTFIKKVGVEEAKRRLTELTDAALTLVDNMTTRVNEKEALVFKALIAFLISREK